MRRVIFNIVFTILALCVVGLAVGIFSFRRDIAITYHRHMMLRDWYRTDRVVPKLSGYIAGFDHHREALTSLGYFNRSAFPLHHIAPDTPELHDLIVVLRDSFTNVADAYFGTTNVPNASFGMRSGPRHTSCVVIVWARPGLQARFETIISMFDVASNTQSLYPSDALKQDGLLRISDGSSYYEFSANGVFRSFPVRPSGRAFIGTWTSSAHPNYLYFTVKARMVWMDGIQPRPDDLSMVDDWRIVFVVGPGLRSPADVRHLATFDGYFFIEELTKLP